MQSNNPVFRRSEEFNRPPAQRLRQPDLRRQRRPPTPATASRHRPVDLGHRHARHAHRRSTSGRMTIDSVVQKTAISLAVVIVAAAATWVLTRDDHRRQPADLGRAAHRRRCVGACGAFALSMVNSFKRVDQPGPGAGVLRRSRASPSARSASCSTPSSATASSSSAVLGTFARLRRHARGVQVLQHPGRRQVPHVRDRRDVRHGRPRPAGAGAELLRHRHSASSASAASACCPPSPAWCSASSC